MKELRIDIVFLKKYIGENMLKFIHNKEKLVEIIDQNTSKAIDSYYEGRAQARKNMYEYINNNLPINHVIECGVGIGEILEYFENYDFNYTILEKEKELCEYFNNKHIVHTDYFEHLKTNVYDNTVFSYFICPRIISDGEDLVKLILKFKKFMFKNNYVCIRVQKDFKYNIKIEKEFDDFMSNKMLLIKI